MTKDNKYTEGATLLDMGEKEESALPVTPLLHPPAMDPYFGMFPHPPAMNPYFGMFPQMPAMNPHFGMFPPPVNQEKIDLVTVNSAIKSMYRAVDNKHAR